jgi:hypothetical protein
MTKLANQIISSDEKMTSTIEHVNLIINDLPFIADKTAIIRRTVPMIDMDKVCGTIDSVEQMTDIRKKHEKSLPVLEPECYVGSTEKLEKH